MELNRRQRTQNRYLGV